MKTFLLFSLFVLPILSTAQVVSQTSDSGLDTRPYARKMWQLGFQGGYSKAQLISNNITTQLYGGYYLGKKLMVGASASWSGEWWHKIIETNLFSVGPMLRYQITQTRFSPFVAAAYRFGRYTSTSQEYSSNSGNSGFSIYQNHTATSIHSRSFSVGLSVGITSALHADIAANWQDVVRSSDAGKIGSNNLWQPQVGINYLLSSKH